MSLQPKLRQEQDRPRSQCKCSSIPAGHGTCLHCRVNGRTVASAPTKNVNSKSGNIYCFTFGLFACLPITLQWDLKGPCKSPIVAPFHFNANLTDITKARVTRQNVQNAFFIYSHHMITIQGLETSCTAFKPSFHSAQTHYAHNGAVYCMHQAAAHNRAVQYTSYVIFIFFVLVQHIMYKSLFHVYTHTPTASTSKRTLIGNNVKLVMKTLNRTMNSDSHVSVMPSLIFYHSVMKAIDDESQKALSSSICSSMLDSLRYH